MRLHTNVIEYTDIAKAAHFSTGQGEGFVYTDKVERHGSRSRNHSFDVLLEGDGTTNKRRRNGEPEKYAATWNQWGWFLGFLFNIDPDMKCWAYDGANDFHEKTKGVFK